MSIVSGGRSESDGFVAVGGQRLRLRLVGRPARSATARTVAAYQRLPPRPVGTPSAFNASAIRTSRAERRRDGPPTDADIERGLRERAVNDPRAAEILLRWMQRPKPVEETPGVDLDSLSYAELERLHAGLMRLTALPENELGALLRHVLEDEPDP
jgi:hypothetical protein